MRSSRGRDVGRRMVVQAVEMQSNRSRIEIE